MEKNQGIYSLDSTPVEAQVQEEAAAKVEDAPSSKWFWALFSLILILALFLRFYDIEARPLHSDEGVNYLFLQDIKNKGVYPYSHENYHGPAYFWASSFATRIVGESVLGMRLASIISGVLLICLLLPMRKYGGDSFVLFGALLIAVTPSMVFHSRYGIHEMLFLLAGTGFAFSAFMLLEMQEAEDIYWAAIYLALAVCTKETFVVTLGSLFFPLLLLCIGRFNDLFAFLKRQEQHFISAFILAVFLVLFIYSSGFRDSKSVREMFFSVPQWVGRGTKSDPGHFKPFSYYLGQLVDVTEPYLIISLCAGVLILLLMFLLVPLEGWTGVFKGKRRLGGYLALWMLFASLIYSAIPYKTPWIVINLTLPAILFMAWLLSMALDFGAWGKAAGSLFTCAAVFVGVRNTAYYNYSSFPLSSSVFSLPAEFQPYGPQNPFSYVHTSPGTLELIKDIQDYWEINPDAKILVGTKGYWPIPYYLRTKASQAGYFVPPDPGSQMKSYDIIIIDSFTRWEAPGWRKKYLRLSDVTEANIFFKPLEGGQCSAGETIKK